MTTTASRSALAEPTEPVGRVWVLWLALVSIGVWAGFFGPIQVLLAQQAEAVAGAHKETVLAPGVAALVLGLGAGYPTLYVLAALAAVLGSFLVRRIVGVP
jgi:hypothetical protein